MRHEEKLGCGAMTVVSVVATGALCFAAFAVSYAVAFGWALGSQ